MAQHLFRSENWSIRDVSQIVQNKVAHSWGQRLQISQTLAHEQQTYQLIISHRQSPSQHQTSPTLYEIVPYEYYIIARVLHHVPALPYTSRRSVLHQAAADKHIAIVACTFCFEHGSPPMGPRSTRPVRFCSAMPGSYSDAYFRIVHGLSVCGGSEC